MLSENWLGSSVSENETREHGGDPDKALYFCRGHGYSKSVCKEDPPYLSLTQAMHLSPSHGSGQGAHASRLANLTQIVPGRRWKEEGVLQEDISAETGAKWNRQDFP